MTKVKTDGYILRANIQWINSFFISWQSDHFVNKGDLTMNVIIVLFYKYFSHSGEQPEQCILAHKSEQPTAGCIQYFRNFTAI